MADWPERPRALVSFAFQKSLDVAVTKGLDLIIDSGAFTASTIGQKINLHEYAENLNRYAPHATAAFNLDVIGDWTASARNFDRLRERVTDEVQLLPVWHTASPTEELARMCREYGYVGIGGAVAHASSPKRLMPALVHAHRVAREHGAQLHGLGITGSTTLFRLPWHTADSSTWQEGHRYGHSRLADRNGRFVPLRWGTQLSYDARRLVRQYGGTPERVGGRGFNQVAVVGQQALEDRSWINRAVGRSFMHIEGVLRARHRSGLRLYLAATAEHAVHDVRPAWEEGSPW